MALASFWAAYTDGVNDDFPAALIAHIADFPPPAQTFVQNLPTIEVHRWLKQQTARYWMTKNAADTGVKLWP